MIRILIVLAALAAVGCMDFEDAKIEERQYCDAVREGLWPDYRGIYQDMCSTGDL